MRYYLPPINHNRPNLVDKIIHENFVRIMQIKDITWD